MIKRLRSAVFAGVLLTGAVVPLLGAGSAAAASGPGLPLIVTFTHVPTAQDLEVLGGLATEVHGFQNIPAAAVMVPSDVVGLLGALPGVKGIYPDSQIRFFDDQSNLAMQSSSVWPAPPTGLGYTGAGVSIGIIDAGIDGTHPDLCAAPIYCKGTPVKTVQNVEVLGMQDVTGPDPVQYLTNQVVTDYTSGHGTHVAGIAAGWGSASIYPGKYQGVAPGASLVGFGTGQLASVDNVLGAFDWAITHKDDYNIRVLNNSWGPAAGTPYDPQDPVNLAIDAAHDAGITVVFGAGNDGPKSDTLNEFSVNPDAISVGGSDDTNQLIFFSSRGVPGSTLWHPTVMAPGYMVVSDRALTGLLTLVADATSTNDTNIATQDLPYYATASGTSMSSPQVAGVVALMQQAAHTSRGAWLTPDQVKNILQNTATPASPNYQTYNPGAGPVNAYAAVLAAQNGTAMTPWVDPNTDDVRTFTGTVGPASVGGLTGPTLDSSVQVAPGATSLDVMADWPTAQQIIDLTVTDPTGAQVGSTFLLCNGLSGVNNYSAFCSEGANERWTVVKPMPGTWHVHVYGTDVVTAQNVLGTWSVAYPTGSALPAADPAASIQITAAVPAPMAGQTAPTTATSSTSVDGIPVQLTATVLDAGGNPVPNTPVSWSSTGVGAVGQTETVSHLDGQAAAVATAGDAGTQVVTVTSGALTATVPLTWLGVANPLAPAPANTPGKASGAGWVNGSAGKIHFALHASYASGAAAPSGQIRWNDPAGTSVGLDAVDHFSISASTATITGDCTVGGSSGYQCTLTATDNGEPGAGNDTVQMVISEPTNPLYSYRQGGTLGGGNVQVASS